MTAVGRLKIKKKETMIPLRQTMAYRMMLLTVWVFIFIWTVYEAVVTWQANNTLAFIIASVAGVLSTFGIFFNLDRLRFAKVPAKTAKRMSRR